MRDSRSRTQPRPKNSIHRHAAGAKVCVFVIRFRCGWQSVGAIATELKLPELLASNGNPVKASPSRRKPVASPLLQNVQF